MQSLDKIELLGFLQMNVGSVAVKVPIRAAGASPEPEAPLASFETNGNEYAILVRGEPSSKAVERAMNEAAHQAMVHLSRKLLN